MNTVDIQQHINDVMRTLAPHYSPPNTTPNVRMLHAAIGMVTESGELLDNWKKAIFYGGRTFDMRNADEEVGDLLWYVMLYCHARAELERTTAAEQLFKLLNSNIAKLRARYPEKFSTEHAENRNVGAEYAAMQMQNMQP